MAEDFREASLSYHRTPRPGKIQVTPTKPLANQRDLALAYSPGVGYACEEIVRDPLAAAEYTARSNLVGVVTNGTAVLGLGSIGPLAAKPVMEGKGVLFKKFAGIDVYDIEVEERDPGKLVDIIASLEPTFGGINLEDIKAPECFEVERRLRQRMNIPVFHDDQHGTAIIVGAAVLNGLRIVGKRIEDVRLVCVGAGAAALACLDLLVGLGLKVEHVTVCDIHGVVYKGRQEEMDPRKVVYAQETQARTLAEVMPGADVLLGLSGPGAVSQAMVKGMAERPLILTLANPMPEITPEEVREVRPDAVIATGRSDYPNQVNNVLCFPYIFRGALDVGATAINEEMKRAAVQAIANLALIEPPDTVVAAYGGKPLSFGPDYFIPKPFDPRLIGAVAPAVAKAAMETGVARLPIQDLEAYRLHLSQFVFQSGLLMKPLFEQARVAQKRVVFAEGEEERVLRAVQETVDEGLAFPVLIGRPKVIQNRINRLGLRIHEGEHFEIVNPQSDPRYNTYWKLYHSLMERKGVSPDYARFIVRTQLTVIAALMVRRGEADAMICGTIGRYDRHLQHIDDVIGRRPGVSQFTALSGMILSKGTLFFCDTYVNPDPSADDIAEMTLLAADVVRRFGIEPKAALLSHSSFGSSSLPDATKMKTALETIWRRAPELEVEGEMHGDAAVSEQIRMRIFPNSRLKGMANLLVMPTLDAANIAMNLIKLLTDGVSIGPILLGAAKPAHILTPSVTVRGILNMTAIASVEAAALQRSEQAAAP